ncbi:MAG: 50S ribosomal protein L6 [Prevotella sp.]|jgi:large subunit ribosomal protein L6|nr:50S ribosomal protein L6 [Prevotella sp.]MBQ6760688.1 50S ribosomal protein L6 [Prevotella sp.]MBQ7452217.1 50S ribosomal protein L6 [Prevotella sp.]MBQ8058848.1 50S ribosomal protein L6 [Prevotella sp.]MBQ8114915.1 50S ribosomal protein L6 [Prevotella sp.]
MSRIGKLPISIPSGVNVDFKDNVVTVKGPKGELSQKVDPSIKVKVEDGQITFEVDENSPVNYKQKNAFHGLYRSLVNNMVVGVSEGYTKTLELVGVGYRVSNKGNLIEFALGYTHPIFLELPKEVKVETKSERNQNPLLILESCDKQLIGLICAKIRSFRKPEPYKGKGILFQGEVIRRKSGKSASAK